MIKKLITMLKPIVKDKDGNSATDLECKFCYRQNSYLGAYINDEWACYDCVHKRDRDIYGLFYYQEIIE